MAELKRLGRYEIIKELGRGGMGIVLLGRDPQLERMVALKIVKIDDSDDSMSHKELLERFYIEAKAAAKISHPNIVTVYDVGEAEGKKFIAMEFVEGKNLANIIMDEGPLPIQRAAKFIHQIADGLSYAHERGIVHRDIKPGNIIVSADDKVKITDFGLARLQSASSVTQTGHAVGSPSYMSPEQVQGMAVDGRSDMFSLGVMFYEMLTQKRPFDGESLTTVIFKIIKDNPIPPSHLNKAVPHVVDDIIAKMTAKEPQYRFPNCGDVANAMLPFMGAQTSFPLTTSDTVKTVSFTKESLSKASVGEDTPPKSRKASGKSLGIVAGAFVFLIAAVIGGIMFFKPGSAPKEATPPAPETVVEQKEEQPKPAEPKVEPPVEKKPEPSAPAPEAKPVVEEKPAPAPTPAPARHGTLTVITSPSGAVVKIDGREKGKSPITITDVNPGERKIEISRQGHASASRTVVVKPGEPSMLEVKLEARTPKIHVDAPIDATVYIDGTRAGTGPVTKDVTEGEFKITVEKEGHATFTQSVKVASGETANVLAKLSPLGKGSISVTAMPWATIHINGKEFGATPKVLRDIPEGKVEIKLSNPAYRAYSTSVTVKANEQIEVAHTFTPAEEVAGGEKPAGSEEAGVGTLKVSSTPAGIVYLDGKVYGRTPVTISDLPAGPHQLTLKRAGMPDYKRKVDISAGIITNIAVE